MPYLNSVLDVFEFVLQKSPNYTGNAAGKVKQEVVHGLGNAFIQLSIWLDSEFYTQVTNA